MPNGDHQSISKAWERWVKRRGDILGRWPTFADAVDPSTGKIKKDAYAAFRFAAYGEGSSPTPRATTKQIPLPLAGHQLASLQERQQMPMQVPVAGAFSSIEMPPSVLPAEQAKATVDSFADPQEEARQFIPPTRLSQTGGMDWEEHGPGTIIERIKLGLDPMVVTERGEPDTDFYRELFLRQRPTGMTGRVPASVYPLAKFGVDPTKYPGVELPEQPPQFEKIPDPRIAEPLIQDIAKVGKVPIPSPALAIYKKLRGKDVPTISDVVSPTIKSLELMAEFSGIYAIDPISRINEKRKNLIDSAGDHLPEWFPQKIADFALEEMKSPGSFKKIRELSPIPQIVPGPDQFIQGFIERFSTPEHIAKAEKQRELFEKGLFEIVGSVASGERYSLFGEEGVFEEVVQGHQDRPLMEQFLLGIISDPTIIAGVLKIPVKATTIAGRIGLANSLRQAARIPKTGLKIAKGPIDLRILNESVEQVARNAKAAKLAKDAEAAEHLRMRWAAERQMAGVTRQFDPATGDVVGQLAEEPLTPVRREVPKQYPGQPYEWRPGVRQVQDPFPERVAGDIEPPGPIPQRKLIDYPADFERQLSFEDFASEQARERRQTREIGPDISESLEQIGREARELQSTIESLRRTQRVETTPVPEVAKVYNVVKGWKKPQHEKLGPHLNRLEELGIDVTRARNALDAFAKFGRAGSFETLQQQAQITGVPRDVRGGLSYQKTRNDLWEDFLTELRDTGKPEISRTAVDDEYIRAAGIQSAPEESAFIDVDKETGVRTAASDRFRKTVEEDNAWIERVNPVISDVRKQRTVIAKEVKKPKEKRLSGSSLIDSISTELQGPESTARDIVLGSLLASQDEAAFAANNVSKGNLTDYAISTLRSKKAQGRASTIAELQKNFGGRLENATMRDLSTYIETLNAAEINRILQRTINYFVKTRAQKQRRIKALTAKVDPSRLRPGQLSKLRKEFTENIDLAEKYYMAEGRKALGLHRPQYETPGVQKRITDLESEYGKKIEQFQEGLRKETGMTLEESRMFTRNWSEQKMLPGFKRFENLNRFGIQESFPGMLDDPPLPTRVQEGTQPLLPGMGEPERQITAIPEIGFPRTGFLPEGMTPSPRYTGERRAVLPVTGRRAEDVIDEGPYRLPREPVQREIAEEIPVEEVTREAVPTTAARAGGLENVLKKINATSGYGGRTSLSDEEIIDLVGNIQKTNISGRVSIKRFETGPSTEVYLGELPQELHEMYGRYAVWNINDNTFGVHSTYPSTADLDLIRQGIREYQQRPEGIEGFIGKKHPDADNTLNLLGENVKSIFTQDEAITPTTRTAGEGAGIPPVEDGRYLAQYERGRPDWAEGAGMPPEEGIFPRAIHNWDNTTTNKIDALLNAHVYRNKSNLRSALERVADIPIAGRALKAIAGESIVSAKDPKAAEALGYRLLQQTQEAELSLIMARFHDNLRDLPEQQRSGIRGFIKGYSSIFKIDKNGRVRLTDGTYIAFGDVAENPGNYAITDQQSKWIRDGHAIIDSLAENYRKITIDEGVKGQEKGRIIAGVPLQEREHYWPRFTKSKDGSYNIADAAGKEGKTGTPSSNMMQRLHKTMEEGLETSDYEINPFRQLEAYAQGLQKMIRDELFIQRLVDKGFAVKKPVSQKGISTLSTPEWMYKRKGMREVIMDEETSRVLGNAMKKMNPNWFTSTTLMLAAIPRFVVTGMMDTGQFFLQGLPLMFTRPGEWSKAVANSMMSMIQPAYYARYISNSPSARRAVKYGLDPMVTSEFFEAVGAFQKLGGKLASPIAKTGVDPAILGKPIAVVPNALQRGFESFLSIGKLAFYDGIEDAIAAANNISKSSLDDMSKIPIKQRQLIEDDLYRAARLADTLIGSTNVKALGLSANQRYWESAFLLFSPRYTRAVFGTLGYMVSKGVAPRYVRNVMLRMALGGMFVAVGIGKALGMSWDEIRKTTLNPLAGSKFMSVRYGEDEDAYWYGVAGGFRSLLVFIAQTADIREWKEVWDSEDLDLINASKDFSGLTSFRMSATDFALRNPISKFIRSKSSVSPIGMGTFIDFMDEEDYVGIPITLSDFVNDPKGFFEYMSKKITPFPVQAWLEVPEEHSVKTKLTAFTAEASMAARTRPESPRIIKEGVHEDVMKEFGYYGRTLGDLSDEVGHIVPEEDRGKIVTDYKDLPSSMQLRIDEHESVKKIKKITGRSIEKFDEARFKYEKEVEQDEIELRNDLTKAYNASASRYGMDTTPGKDYRFSRKVILREYFSEKDNKRKRAIEEGAYNYKGGDERSITDRLENEYYLLTLDSEEQEVKDVYKKYFGEDSEWIPITDPDSKMFNWNERQRRIDKFIEINGSDIAETAKKRSLSKMPPIEAEFIADRDYIIGSNYWNTRELIAEELGVSMLLKEYEDIYRRNIPESERFLLENPTIRKVITEAPKIRMEMRIQNPELQNILMKWGYVETEPKINYMKLISTGGLIAR